MKEKWLKKETPNIGCIITSWSKLMWIRTKRRYRSQIQNIFFIVVIVKQFDSKTSHGPWTINWLKSIENEKKSKGRNQSIAKSTFFHLFTCCTWKISKEVPNDIKIKWLNSIFIYMSCDGSFSFQYTKLTSQDKFYWEAFMLRNWSIFVLGYSLRA